MVRFFAVSVLLSPSPAPYLSDSIDIADVTTLEVAEIDWQLGASTGLFVFHILNFRDNVSP